MLQNPDQIQDQVRLPIRVAFEVVLQGIQIRFGRSLVTVMGVVLGIAFLMAMLTGEQVKEGVSGEDLLRQETKRMVSFLVAEMGPPAGRTLAVVQVGRIGELESRFLLELEQGGLRAVHWADLGSASGSFRFVDPSRLKLMGPDKVGEKARALVVVGEGRIEEAGLLQVAAQAALTRQHVLAFTRRQLAREFAAIPGAEGMKKVVLEREMKPDEKAKIEKDQARGRFRRTWIIIVSIFVTIIGISNAMLMSVTERFREIGTMKCLGALSGFIRTLFLIESSLMGLVGGALGGLLGMLFASAAYGFTYGFPMTFSSLSPALLALHFLFCLVAGVVLSILAAIYPARLASRMVPAHALRSNV